MHVTMHMLKPKMTISSNIVQQQVEALVEHRPALILKTAITLQIYYLNR